MGLACNIAWRAPGATADKFAELVPNWSWNEAKMSGSDWPKALEKASAMTLLLAESVDEPPEDESTEDDDLPALAFEVETEDCFLCVERTISNSRRNTWQQENQAIKY